MHGHLGKVGAGAVKFLAILLPAVVECLDKQLFRFHEFGVRLC
jgi:hypothetical protein